VGKKEEKRREVGEAKEKNDQKTQPSKLIRLEKEVCRKEKKASLYRKKGNGRMQFSKGVQIGRIERYAERGKRTRFGELRGKVFGRVAGKTQVTFM